MISHDFDPGYTGMSVECNQLVTDQTGAAVECGAPREAHGLAWGDGPYDAKSPDEVVYDYAVTRGDLSSAYGRRQLADWIQRYAEHHAATQVALLTEAAPAPPPRDRDVDPLWSDLYQHVQVNITLPENMELLLRPDAAVDQGRWYYQIECERPDTFTGRMGKGRGGKAYLTPHSTEGELVQTAFGLLKAYVEHEAREAFQWKGRRVFGPHIATSALWDAAERTEYRS